MLIYHLRLLLGDLRVREIPPIAEPAPAPGVSLPVLLLVQSQNLADGTAALAAFQQALPPGSQIEVFPAADLTPVEVSNWLATRRPALPPAIP